MDELEADITRTKVAFSRAFDLAQVASVGRSISHLLRERYDETTSLSHLDEAIAFELLLSQRLYLNSAYITDLSLSLSTLGNLYSTRFSRSSTLVDQAKSRFFYRYCLNICPDDRIHLRATIKSQLSGVLLTFAEATEDLARYDEALRLSAEASLININTQEQANTMGNIYRQRYLRSGLLSDLEQSLEHLKIASNSQDGYLTSQSISQNLGYTLHLLFLKTGDSRYIDQAISAAELSLQDTDKLSPESECTRVGNLASFLTSRYEVQMNIKDLDKAIQIIIDSRERLSPGNPQRARLSVHLANCLRLRYYRYNHMEDLNRGIQAAEYASSGRFPTIRSRTTSLHELGLLLMIRVKRQEQPDDFATAVACFEEIKTLLGPTDASYANTCDMMSMLFLAKYEKTSVLKHLHRSIEEAEECLAHSNPMPTLVQRSNTALKYVTMAGAVRQGKIDYLNKADEQLQYCFAPDGSPVSPSGTNIKAHGVAGSALEMRHSLTAQPDDTGLLEQAASHYLCCWNAVNIPLLERLTGLQQAVSIMYKLGHLEQAWQLSLQALQVVPIFASAGSTIEDVTDLLARVSGLGSDACAIGLALGRVEEALEALEIGRGVVINTTYSAVPDLDRLKQASVDQYNEFLALRSQLNLSSSAVLSSQPTTEVMLDEFERRKRLLNLTELSNTFQALVAKIRDIPSFENFLEPLKAKTMQELAGEGAIVVLNSSRFRSDAIIVRAESIERLTISDQPNQVIQALSTRRISGQFIRGLVMNPLNGRDDWDETNSKLRGILYWLWLNVGLPICQKLGLEQGRPDLTKLDERRIHWITTGAFTGLPIHAAGQYVKGDTDSVCRRAISSYVASFRVLRYALSRSEGVQQASSSTLRKKGGLLVQMSRARGVKKTRRFFFTSAAREAAAIEEATHGISWSNQIRPSAEEVITALPSSSYVHLICHGVTDPATPSNSHLLLWKQRESQEVDSAVNVDRLSVSEISQSVTKDANVAFLSACSTAAISNAGLYDESLHIGNAFQLAGFPHVVGSLWAACDHILPMLSQAFWSYTQIFAETKHATNAEVAYCLHVAVGKLMISHLEEPLLWACFVHIGA